MKRVKHKISDFIADYKGYEVDEYLQKPPISISNHVSLIDVLIFLTLPTLNSFLSKESVRNFPLIGPICDRIQSIYLVRSDNIENRVVLFSLYRYKNFILFIFTHL